MGQKMTFESNNHWISVDASSGMFSNEFAVSIRLFDGQTVSLFVDQKLIKQTSGQSFLKVYLVETNTAKKKELVLLPSETFETSSRWVEVPAS